MSLKKPQITSIVHEFMSAVITASNDTESYPEFRASAFPYCPLIAATTDFTGVEEYKSGFYFEVGTAIHNLLQHFSAFADCKPELFGNWECTSCKKLKTLRVKPTKPCITCTSEGKNCRWKYSEVEIKWKGLSGHVDTIIRLWPEGGRKYYIPIDYKTTEFRFGGSNVDRKKFPYENNVIQLEVYCALLKELFNLNIAGWALIYAHRGRPLRGPSDYHIVPGTWDEDSHDSMMRALTWAQKANSYASRIIKNRYEGKEIPEGALEKIVAMRPCKSIEKWESWMKCAFKYSEFTIDGEGACPHLTKCLGSNETKVIRYFRKILTQMDCG